MSTTKCVHCCESSGHDPNCIVAVVRERNIRDKARAITPERKRLQAMCNRLALAPIRVCRSLHSCVFCGQPIRYGDQYRDKGLTARAHEICFKAVAAPWGKGGIA